MESLSKAGFSLETLASSGLLLEEKKNKIVAALLSLFFRGPSFKTGKDSHDGQLTTTFKSKASYKPMEGSLGLGFSVSLSINWQRHLLQITFSWIRVLNYKG